MLRAVIFLLFSVPAFAQLQDDIFVQTDRFLKKNVKNGQVKYAEISQNRQELDIIVKRIESVNYTTFFDNLRKAYLINTYNILVIKQVIDKYPVVSTEEIKGFFPLTKFNVNGKNITLDELEKEIIFKQFTDPRIHFALIKGANGSPPIPNFSFNPQKIDKELDDQCEKVLNDPAFVRLGNRKVLLSQIFEWNQADFNDKGQTMIQFINRYRDDKISDEWAIGFYPFDWTLNDIMLWEIAQSEKDSTQKKKPVKKDTLQSLQTLTPSKLTPQGRIELKTFNNLYSQTQAFSYIRRRELGKRDSYFTSINQVMYGQTKNLSIGFEVWIKSVYVDSTSSSALDIFGNKPQKYFQTAISGIGPKVKAKPFKKAPNLTLQSTLLIPFQRDLEGRKSKKPYLSADAAVLINQLMYDKLGKKWQFFTQISPTFTFGRSIAKSRVALPVSFYGGYLVSKSIFIYVQNEAYPVFGKGFLASAYLQQGIGTKIQLVPKKLEAEIAYNYNTLGYKNGAGSGINFGLRMLK